MPESPTTIVLADDHAVVRSALRALLDPEPGFDVRAEAASIPETIRLVAEVRPTVLVLDLTMASESALETIPQLLEESPETRIVVVTMHDDVSTARRALDAGASGYVLKAAAASELIEAVRSVAAGATHISPQLEPMLARMPEAGHIPGDLTERETEVLKLIALGHTNSEVAERLHLSVRTVESHRVHVNQKLGIQNRAELVRYALDHGLMEA